MEYEGIIQLMQGNYSALVNFGHKADEFEYVVEKDTISFRTGLIVDPRSKWNTVNFTLEKNISIRQFDAWDIKLSDDIKHKRECDIFHIEEVDGHPVRFISTTAFEYDGRGLIVLGTYVNEEDKAFVPEK